MSRCPHDRISIRSLDGARRRAGARGASGAAKTDQGLIAGLEQWEAIGRVVDAQRIAFAAEVAERSRRELGEEGLAATLGHCHPARLIEDRLRITRADARRRIDLGTSLAPRRSLDGASLPSLHPVLAPAVLSGDIGLDAAHLIASMLDAVAARAHPEDLVVPERVLTEMALTTTPNALYGAIAAWRDALDPDGAQPNEREQHGKRRFDVKRERGDGMVPFSGLATPEAAAVLREALNAHRVKDRPEPLADGSPAPFDERTGPQAAFDVLMGIIRAGTSLEAEGATGTGRTTHEVVVQVDASDLADGIGVGWLDDAETPVPAVTVARMMCDAVLRYVITGDSGEPLWLGRGTRRFRRAQRRAMAAQTGGCAFPGCTAPPAWCDGHHADQWCRDDGPTDIGNGVLLCPYHHRWIHLHPDYRFQFRDGVPELVQSRWADEAPITRAANRHRGRVSHEARQRMRGTRSPKPNPRT